MHEYSVAQALMDRIDAAVAAHQAARVHRVRLRIGESSGVEPDLLAQAFSLIKERTVCASADLVIDRVPVRWACRICDTNIATGGVLRCPACGGAARMADGDEIVLAQLELEVP